jgi:hypothetical protein
MAVTCGAIVVGLDGGKDDNNDDVLSGLLSEAIVAHVIRPVESEIGL